MRALACCRCALSFMHDSFCLDNHQRQPQAPEANRLQVPKRSLLRGEPSWGLHSLGESFSVRTPDEGTGTHRKVITVKAVVIP